MYLSPSVNNWGISIQHNLLFLAHLSLKFCVAANISNKLYEGLITTNPLKSNLRHHITACLLLMCFCFRRDARKQEHKCLDCLQAPEAALSKSLKTEK